ncbi:MAG TPA: hypothetical protein VFZ48_00120 [Candidatus Saccharimonadales bacterium]
MQFEDDCERDPRVTSVSITAPAGQSRAVKIYLPAAVAAEKIIQVI